MVWADYLNETVEEETDWRILKHLRYGAEKHYFSLWRKKRFLWLSWWSLDSWLGDILYYREKIKRMKGYQDGTAETIIKFKEAK